MDKLNQLKETPKIKDDIPKYGSHMLMSDFIECCIDGDFIDYDGWGDYADDKYIYDITIRPSDIINNQYRKDFTHIVWYNK